MIDKSEIFELVWRIGDGLKSKGYKGGGYLAHDKNKNYLYSSVIGQAVKGWVYLYKFSKKSYFKSEAKKCGEWLLKNQTREGGWKFPIRLGSNPPGTQYSCTAIVNADALLDLYELSKEEKFLQSALKVKDFIKHYSKFEKTDKGYLVHYSRRDKRAIPNVSAMAAGLFSRLYNYVQDKRQILSEIDLMISYVLNNQRPDGAFTYFDIECDSKTIAPDYHALTIWELKKILNFKEALGRSTNPIREKILKGIKYLETLVKPNGFVTYRDAKNFTWLSPPELLKKIYYSHTCTLKGLLWAAKAFFYAPLLSNKYLKLADKCIEFSLQKMRARNGNFYFKLTKFGPLSFPKIKSIRGDVIAFEVLSERINIGDSFDRVY